MSHQHIATLCPCGRPAVDQFDKVGRCAKCKALEERYQATHARMHRPDGPTAAMSEHRVLLPARVLREFML